ncbi:MAG: hypothetical protein KF773_29965 [Deltaproteobacteria bacterium]|nr:hypothetical protein [Deltaproteobacteria bacterium]
MSAEALRAISPSCALDKAGRISCRTSELRDAPAGEFTAIDDTEADACALDATGRVACWSAQTVWRPPADKLVAVHVTPRGPFGIHPASRDVRAAACGLEATGGIRCWEAGADGRTLAIAGSYTDLAVADERVFALDARGTLLHWSDDGAGVVRKTEELAGPYTSVTARGVTTCVRADDGKASCWARDFRAPSLVLGAVRQIQAGNDHACVLQAGGDILCVGNRPPPRTKFAALGPPGAKHTCAIAMDRRGYCWGDPGRR